MAPTELPKTFDSKAAEGRWFQLWIGRGYFKVDPSREGPVFSIVIPPPNVIEGPLAFAQKRKPSWSGE